VRERTEEEDTALNFGNANINPELNVLADEKEAFGGFALHCT
jgi:hypothetical protein